MAAPRGSAIAPGTVIAFHGRNGAPVRARVVLVVPDSEYPVRLHDAQGGPPTWCRLDGGMLYHKNKSPQAFTLVVEAAVDVAVDEPPPAPPPPAAPLIRRTYARVLTTRWVGFVAMMFSAISAGNIYFFPLFADAIKSNLRLSQAQIAVTQTSITLGSAVPIGGFVFDRFGPSVTFLGGGVLSLLGYGGLYYLVSTRTFVGPAGCVLSALCCFLKGQSAAWLDSSIVATALLNFEDHSGKAIGIMKALVAMASACVAQLYHTSGMSQTTFIAIVGVYCGVAPVIAGAGMAVVPLALSLAVERKQCRDGESATRFSSRRMSLAMASTFCLVVLQLLATVARDDNAVFQVLAALLPFVFVCVPFVLLCFSGTMVIDEDTVRSFLRGGLADEGGFDEAEQQVAVAVDEATANSDASKGNGAAAVDETKAGGGGGENGGENSGAAVADKVTANSDASKGNGAAAVDETKTNGNGAGTPDGGDAEEPPQEHLPPSAMVRTPAFLYLAVVVATMSGTAMTTSGNISLILGAAGQDNRETLATTTGVFASMNALSRLAFGCFMDVCNLRPSVTLLNGVVCMLFASCLLAATTTATPTLYGVGIALEGWAQGCVWVAVPSLVRALFGTAHLGANLNVLTGNQLLGVLLFNNVVAASVYEAYAEYPPAADGQSDPPAACQGSSCFRLTFLIQALCLVGALACATALDRIIIRRTRGRTKPGGYRELTSKPYPYQ